MNKCNRCGSNYELRVEPRTLRFDSRRQATVNAEFYQCTTCGDTFSTFEQADAARFAASKEIRRMEGLLMPEEIVDLRKHLGLSQALFQRLIGKGKKTVVRWEAGAVFQSGLADKFLRVIRKFPGVVPFLAELEGVSLPTMPKPLPTPPPSQYMRVGHRRRIVGGYRGGSAEPASVVEPVEPLAGAAG